MSSQILLCLRIFPTTPDSRTLYQDLKILDQNQAKHRSHLNFIILCLKSNIIPRDLKFVTQPQVPESNLQHELLKKWNELLQGTSRTLLKLLKTYHRRLNSVLADEIVALKAQLQKRQDFHTIVRNIDGSTKKVADEYENKKAKKV